jgi:hypothetical protein
MFNNQGGLKDALSQLTGNEYRQADYPSWADRGGMLIEVPLGGALFQQFEAHDAASWGGTSTPARIAKTACTH